MRVIKKVEPLTARARNPTQAEDVPPRDLVSLSASTGKILFNNTLIICQIQSAGFRPSLRRFRDLIRRVQYRFSVVSLPSYEGKFVAPFK